MRQVRALLCCVKVTVLLPAVLLDSLGLHASGFVEVAPAGSGIAAFFKPASMPVPLVTRSVPSVSVECIEIDSTSEDDVTPPLPRSARKYVNVCISLKK